MRILVGIANYGTANQHFLQQLLHEYRSLAHDVHVVVFSNIPKELGADVEVVVGLPTSNPWSLPFGHRPLFAERLRDHDLFIYSEDDTLFTAANLNAFLGAQQTLREDELAGFVRSERDPDGALRYVDMHSCYRWDPASVRERGGELFARYTNEHAAFYILTRAQLQRAIASGGFLVPPYEGRHDMLCAAATDPYTRCGFTKLVCVSRLAEFTLPHLPNKYAGRYGLAQSEVELQIGALRDLARTTGARESLFEPESKLPRARWSKNLYETPHASILDLVPSVAHEVLVVGCGWGATEEALARRGQQVAALPLDSVLAARVRVRGVEVVTGSFDEAARALATRRFDCVVFPEMLHLLEHPARILRQFAGLVRPGGSVVVYSPNSRRFATVLGRLGGHANSVRLGSFAESGVQVLTPRRAASWLRQCGCAVGRCRLGFSPRRRIWHERTLGLAGGLLADDFSVRAVKRP